MNQLTKKLFILILTLIMVGYFNIDFIQAQNDKLILEVTKECDIKYSGDSCIAELKLINNTGKILDGEASLHIDYQGICSGNELENFDGEGIEARFSIIDDNWLNFSGWKNGTTKVSGFEITKGETQPNLEIKTVPNLCPGEYNFKLELKGTTEKEEYITPPVVIGGYYSPPSTPITNTGKVTATPGEGGITTLINLDGSGTKLIIPASAVSLNTDFIVEKVDIASIEQPSLESGLFLIDELVYNIKARRGTELIAHFNKPLTLIFTYTKNQVKEFDENSLKIYYWNGENWVALEDSRVNRKGRTVTVSIDHFTLFALLGSKMVVIEKEKPTEEKVPPKEEMPAEEIVLPPTKEEVEKPEEFVPEGAAPTEGGIVTVPPEERVAGEGLASLLLASLGEIGETPWMAIIATFCLIGLVVIGIRERELAGKKKKGIS